MRLLLSVAASTLLLVSMHERGKVESGSSDVPGWRPAYPVTALHLPGTNVSGNLTLTRGKWTLPAAAVQAPIVVFHCGFTVR